MFLANNEDKTVPNGFLSMSHELGQAYLQDLLFCQQYALDNRKTMMKMVIEILGESWKELGPKMINENHNHAIPLEDGTVLHRKGATPADIGQLGVIPGNMRDGVYITEGLGNEEYLSSTSHGAGRKYGRNAAKKNLDLERFKKQMKGIIAKVDKNVLDEAPDAYKKLADVIERQEGIVMRTIDYVKPFINIKG